MISIGGDVKLNLEKLIATRMLINANSGGGKSWAIRRLLEQSHGQVQQILIDLEGEFSTLREKFDYLLVGKGGEIPANIKTAELLAKRLLELNVSTIVDLSELKQPERITFVKRFLDSLINSPKELWHPCLIIIDEAHHFCPEGAKSESASAVIDLMTRGRKRGFAGIIATQRISKLSKDAIAEANNCMIGRASLDIDQKRASETLGFTTKDDTRSLRDLKAGEFYAFGPAFKHNGVEKVMVGEIQTTHPDRTKGINMKEAAPTPENIKKLLKDITDLPKEAEEELKTTEDMKRKIKELKFQLTMAERAKPSVEIDSKSVERAREQGFKQGVSETEKKYKGYIREISEDKKHFDRIMKECTIALNKSETFVHPAISEPEKKQYKFPEEIQEQRFAQGLDNQTPLRAGAMRMLNWLASVYPSKLSKNRLAALSGFSVNGGTFNTYISKLKRNGWIVGNNELAITKEGLDNASPEEMPSGEELLALWKGKFREGAARILQYLYENYPNSVTKEDIGYATSFEPSGGTFNTYISELRRNNLIVINGDAISISEEFFE